MAKKVTLPPDDLRASAAIGEADIQSSKAFVARMKESARYWFGKRLLTMPAVAARRFWTATEQINAN